MKAKIKARIALSTIVLLGLASVSIAISKRSSDFVFVQQNQGSGPCNKVLLNATFVPGGPPIGIKFATNLQGACPFQYWLYIGA